MIKNRRVKNMAERKKNPGIPWMRVFGGKDFVYAGASFKTKESATLYGHAWKREGQGRRKIRIIKSRGDYSVYHSND